MACRWHFINNKITQRTWLTQKLLISYLSISHGGKRPINPCCLCGHGQQGGHAQGHSSRHRATVQPEGDPGHNHQHAGGHVNGQQVVRELSLENQRHFQAAVFPCVGDGVAVWGFKLLQLEPGQVQVLRDLHWVGGFPVIDEVICGPPIWNSGNELCSNCGPTYSWLSSSRTAVCPRGTAWGPWGRREWGRSCNYSSVRQFLVVWGNVARASRS